MKLIRRAINRTRRNLRQRRYNSMQSRFIEKDDRFSEIVDTLTPVERVAGGFVFTEGPIWIGAEHRLLLSDIPADTIYSWHEDRGVEVFRRPSGNANGLTLDIDGRLLACEHGTRRVSRAPLNAAPEILAERHAGKRLNSPNDIVVSSTGAIYFTDPPYGLEGKNQELPFQGVFRIGPSETEPVLLVDDFDRPNGLAFSPDELTLYVDDSSERRHIRAFDVGQDGMLSNGRLFCDMNTTDEGVPDGMKVDELGNVFCTGAGGLWVIAPDGTHLGTVALPELPANCAWGDADFRSLYITARTGLYKLRTQTKGIGIHID